MAQRKLKTTFQVRRATSTWLEENNPVLAKGEPCLDVENNILKIGDGVTQWIELPIPNQNQIISLIHSEKVTIINTSLQPILDGTYYGMRLKNSPITVSINEGDQLSSIDLNSYVVEYADTVNDEKVIVDGILRFENPELVPQKSTEQEYFKPNLLFKPADEKTYGENEFLIYGDLLVDIISAVKDEQLSFK